MLSYFVLHVLALVEIYRQLLYFKTVLIIYLVGQTASVLALARLCGKGLSARLSLVVVRELYFRVALFR